MGVISVADVDKIIQLALSHEGRGERTGRNDGAYVESVVRERVPAGKVGPAWCAAWIMMIHEWAGYPIARLGKTGDPALLPFWECRNVAHMHHELLARGCLLGKGDRVQRGDVALQLGAHVPNAVASGHIDLVVDVDRAHASAVTRVIGGNVSDAVRIRTRSLWSPYVTAYARPLRILGAA